jgi:RNA polymerase sigma factor (sigma-70 family)
MNTSAEPLTGETEEMLLARVRAGDEDAWHELFNTCYPKVIRVVRRKLDRPLRNLYDSTDFASDVMKSLAEKFNRYDFPSIDSLLKFLKQTAEQKVIDEYRRRHTLKRNLILERPIDAGDGGGSDTLASGDPTPSQVAQAGEVEARIFANRTEVERLIIDMRRQGSSTSEIAQRVNWNPRRVQRFLEDLHREIE